MSRYTILVILNTPFIIAGILNALIAYKLSKITTRRFVLQLIFWLVIFTSLVAAEPIYRFLFSNNLTATEPLSLFDVMQITGIVAIFFMANRTRTKLYTLERRVQDLHQELSIKLSQTHRKD
jgi:hypothetical protein